jgi:hypothetical protein
LFGRAPFGPNPSANLVSVWKETEYFFVFNALAILTGAFLIGISKKP